MTTAQLANWLTPFLTTFTCVSATMCGTLKCRAGPYWISIKRATALPDGFIDATRHHGQPAHCNYADNIDTSGDLLSWPSRSGAFMTYVTELFEKGQVVNKLHRSELRSRASSSSTKQQVSRNLRFLKHNLCPAEEVLGRLWRLYRGRNGAWNCFLPFSQPDNKIKNGHEAVWKPGSTSSRAERQKGDGKVCEAIMDVCNVSDCNFNDKK